MSLQRKTIWKLNGTDNCPLYFFCSPNIRNSSVFCPFILHLTLIHLNSIFHESVIINCLPESLPEDEIPSILYSLANTIRNKNFNHKNTIKTLTLTIPRTCGTCIILCNCANSKYLNNHHQHTITGDLCIIEN